MHDKSHFGLVNILKLIFSTGISQNPNFTQVHMQDHKSPQISLLSQRNNIFHLEFFLGITYVKKKQLTMPKQQNELYQKLIVRYHGSGEPPSNVAYHESG